MDCSGCAQLLDIFSRRTRFSPVQGRLWCRVVHLYWRAGWTAREIGEHFGVSPKNYSSHHPKPAPRGTAIFGQALQPPEGQGLQPIVEPASKSRVEPVPIAPDPTNESQAYWEQVLASHGLFNPDKRAKGWTRKIPSTNSNGKARPAYMPRAGARSMKTKPRPKPACHTLQKTGGSRSWGKSKQIGTRTTEIDGKSHDVRVFETGRACTFAWNTNLRRGQKSAHESTQGLAHTVTLKDIEGHR